MFSKTAQFYDLIYSFKDYATEAKKIKDLILAEHPSAKTVLDVACGTGEHARHMANDFEVDGIDLEPELLAEAGEKVPTADFSVADMRSFQLEKKYDAVQCLFSSIGYLTSPEDVVSALTCFKNHLNPKGIIIVEPWLTPDVYQTGMPHMIPPVDQTDLKIVRMNVSEIDGNISRLHFHYLIATKEGVEHLEEEHELALYTVEQMQSFFLQAGLKVNYDPEGIFERGLYIAREST